MELSPFQACFEKVFALVDQLTSVGIKLQHVDVGGGLGIRYDNIDQPPTPEQYAEVLAPFMNGRSIDVFIEPGRSIVGDAGVLITRVEHIKETSDKNFALVDAAMNDFMRPSLYSAWHDIVPIEQISGSPARYDVVGPVCETGDFLGKQRELIIQEGSLLAVHAAGAYGAVMSSNYNTRLRAAEVLVNGDQAHLIRLRETFDQVMANENHSRLVNSMERVVEPELMNEPEQVLAYSNADFDEAHQSVIDNFSQIFPDIEPLSEVLDLGCGAGDVTVRFAKRYTNCHIDAVDGADEMLKQAASLISSKALNNRITLHLQQLPNCIIEHKTYDAIISNSLLHHLHEPQHIWSTIKQYATTDTAIYVCDLYRPDSIQDAKDLVDQYASNEPEVLRKDFYNSLLAAFTPDEVRTQISIAELDGLDVDKVSDRHMLIYGYLQ